MIMVLMMMVIMMVIMMLVCFMMALMMFFMVLIAAMVANMIMVLMMMVIMMLVCFMMALMMFIVIVVLLMMLISFMMNMLFFMTNNIGGPGNINLGVCTMSMKEFNTFLHIFGVNDCLTNSLGNLCLLHHFFGMALFFFLVFTVGSRVETCRLAVVNSRSLVSVMIIFMMNINNN